MDDEEGIMEIEEESDEKTENEAVPIRQELMQSNKMEIPIIMVTVQIVAWSSDDTKIVSKTEHPNQEIQVAHHQTQAMFDEFQTFIQGQYPKSLVISSIEKIISINTSR